MSSKTAQEFADQLAELLADWVDRLPDAGSSSQKWLRALTKAPPDLREAMGFPAAEDELRTIRRVIASDAPTYAQFKLNQDKRLQIYLGGVEGIAASPGTHPHLAMHSAKLHAIRQLLKRKPAGLAGKSRTLSSIAKAVDVGSLREFHTTEVDSDLWVVLKTVQENWETKATQQLILLIDYVVNVVAEDIRNPGLHIADRRHAWWAARTLYQARSLGLSGVADTTLAGFLDQLMNEPTYITASLGAHHSLVPEFHEKIVGGWELINICEMLRGWPNDILDNVFLRLTRRERELMGDLMSDELPRDMRVATVYLRACMTYLAESTPLLWGKDV